MTPKTTGSSLPSYLPSCDSMRQTIVCCHIIQAEIIRGEHRVSPHLPLPPEAATRTEETCDQTAWAKMYSSTMKSACRWLTLVRSPFLALGSRSYGAELQFNPWNAKCLFNFVPHSNLRGCHWQWDASKKKNDILLDVIVVWLITLMKFQAPGSMT